MEENKELENTTEEQASVTPAANNGEKKGLFLSGFIVGFAATLLIVGGIFIAFQIHNIMTMKDDVAAQVSYGEDSAVNAQTIKKLQLLEDTVSVIWEFISCLPISLWKTFLPADSLRRAGTKRVRY